MAVAHRPDRAGAGRCAGTAAPFRGSRYHVWECAARPGDRALEDQGRRRPGEGLPTRAYLVGTSDGRHPGLFVVPRNRPAVRRFRSSSVGDGPGLDSCQLAVRATDPLTVLLGLAWIALSSWPLLLQFHVSSTLEGSRYLYLPAVGFALVMSAAFARPSRGAISFIATTACLCLIAIICLRIGAEGKFWTHAATERDRLLSEVSAAALQHECRTIVVQGVPDNIRGVYVFREGWQEALARVPRTPNGAPCRWSWDDSGLRLH